MKKSTDIKFVRVVGIYPGNSYFQLYGVDDQDKERLDKKLMRSQLGKFMAK